MIDKKAKQRASGNYWQSLSSSGYVREITDVTERGERFTLHELIERLPGLKGYDEGVQRAKRYLQPAGRIGLRRAYTVHDRFSHMQEEPLSEYINVTHFEPKPGAVAPDEIAGSADVHQAPSLPPADAVPPVQEPDEPTGPSLPSPEGYRWKRSPDEIQIPMLKGLAGVGALYEAGGGVTVRDLKAIDPETFGEHGQGTRRMVEPYLQPTGEKRDGMQVLCLMDDVRSYLDSASDIPSRLQRTKRPRARSGSAGTPTSEITDEALQTLYIHFGETFILAEAKSVLPDLAEIRPTLLSDALQRAGCAVDGIRKKRTGPVNVYRIGGEAIERYKSLGLEPPAATPELPTKETPAHGRLTDETLKRIYEKFGDDVFTVADVVDMDPNLGAVHGLSIVAELKRRGCTSAGKMRKRNFTVGTYRLGDDLIALYGQGSHPSGPAPSSPAPPTEPQPTSAEEEAAMKAQLERMLPDLLDHLDSGKSGKAESPDRILGHLGDTGMDADRFESLLIYGSNHPEIVSYVLGDGCALERTMSQNGKASLYSFAITPDILRDSESTALAAMAIADAVRRGPRPLKSVAAASNLGVTDEEFEAVIDYLIDNPEKMRDAAGKALLYDDRHGLYLEGTQLPATSIRVSSSAITTLSDLVAAGFAERPDTDMLRSVGNPQDGMLQRRVNPDFARYLELFGGTEVDSGNYLDIGPDGVVLVTQEDGDLRLELYNASGREIRWTSIYKKAGVVHASCDTFLPADKDLLPPFRQAGKVIAVNSEAVKHFNELRHELFGDMPYASVLTTEGWNMLVAGAPRDNIVYAAAHLSDGSPENIEMAANHMGVKLEGSRGLLKTLVLEKKLFEKKGRFTPWKDDKPGTNQIYGQGSKSIQTPEFEKLKHTLGAVFNGCDNSGTRLAMGLYTENEGANTDVVRVFGMTKEEAFMLFGTLSHKTTRPDNFQQLENGVRLTRPFPRRDLGGMKTRPMSEGDLQVLLQSLHWRGSYREPEED